MDLFSKLGVLYQKKWGLEGEWRFKFKCYNFKKGVYMQIVLKIDNPNVLEKELLEFLNQQKREFR